MENSPINSTRAFVMGERIDRIADLSDGMSDRSLRSWNQSFGVTDESIDNSISTAEPQGEEWDDESESEDEWSLGKLNFLLWVNLI